MGLRPAGNSIGGAGRPAPRHKRRYICGVSPRTLTENHYIWGFAPCPDLGSFFGKKLPKDPKKPNCIGFYLSNNDSEQGCRRQPCFMFGAHSAAPQPPRCPTRLPFVPHPPPVRARRTHPAKALKLQAFGFFAKHFKLCSQFAERK